MKLTKQQLKNVGWNIGQKHSLSYRLDFENSRLILEEKGMFIDSQLKLDVAVRREAKKLGYTN
jgi:hypothetical protein